MSVKKPLKKQLAFIAIIAAIAFPITSNADQLTITPQDLIIDHLIVDSVNIPHAERLNISSTFGILCIKLNRSIPAGPVSYRIKELGKRWTIVGTDQHIIIHRLPVGLYTIEIRSAIQGIQHITLEVKSASTQYKNLVLFGILGISIIFAYYKWPRSGHHQLAFRTALSPSMHFDEQRMNDIRISKKVEKEGSNINFITLMFHDVRSHLVFLEKVCHQIYQTEKTNNPNIAKAMGEIRSTSVALCGFAESFTPWILMKDQKIDVQRHKVVIKDLINELKEMYSSMAEFRNNTIQTSIDNNAIIYNDERLLRVIIRNLIDNANKNTRNGHIFINAYSNESGITIEVRDTGKGLTETQVAELNALFAFDRKTEIKGSGLGLLMIADLIRLTNGRCEASNESGAVFKLSFSHL